MVDPKIGSSYSFLLKDVLNAKEIIDGKLSTNKLAVSAPDEQTFVVELAQPTNPFLSYITTPNVFVVSPQIIEKFGAVWTKPQILLPVELMF